MAESCLLVLKNPCREEPRVIRLSSSANGLSTEDLRPPFVVNRTCVDATCVVYYDNEDYLLWNPVTDEHKVIPAPNFELTPCDYAQYHTSCSQFHYCTNSGLGFDPNSGDYKFIKFTCILYAEDENCTHSFLNQISVYSLKRNSWKEIPNAELYGFMSYHAVSLNGFCYWLSIENVIAFNLATDELSSLPFPNILIYRGCERYLIEYDGLLSFVVCSRYGDTKCFRFWIMDVEDGVVAWIRKEKLVVCGRGALSPLGFCNNGCSFLLQGRYGNLLVYDFVAREMKSIEEIFDYPICMKLFSYAESAIKLNAYMEQRTLEKKKKTRDKKRKNRKNEGDDEELRVKAGAVLLF